MAAKNTAAEITDTTGLGAYQLGGALPGFLTVAASYANAALVHYRVERGQQKEWSKGRFLALPNRLTRDLVEASTNGGAALNWAAGRKHIYIESAVAIEDVGGLGAGVATFLATPSSANLGAAMADKTGLGLLVFGESPTFSTNVKLAGATSGSLTIKAPAIAGANTLTFPAGTTDFSTTGGAGKALRQLSTGGGITVENVKYPVMFSAPQTTAFTASQVIGHHRFSRAVTIPANFGAHLGDTSQAGGSANATASTVISVERAAAATPNSFSQVGTITIAAGSVTPTFASSGGTAISFAQGDVMRLIMPASPDATFAGLYVVIVGYEV